MTRFDIIQAYKQLVVVQVVQLVLV